MAPQEKSTKSSSNNVVKGPPDRHLPQHGVKGAYYCGSWVDIEDCAGTFFPAPGTASHETSSSSSLCKSCPNNNNNNNNKKNSCPRSKSRNDASKDQRGKEYDVVIIGAGCVGATIARELSRYSVSILLLEAADDVSQGATKGNSGIVHAGYDDKPGSTRAKFCWRGNQMFAHLDEQLRFGYQKNGSLVLAFTNDEVKHLEELKQRGETNGVQNLRVLTKEEVFELEPAVHPDVKAALHSPDAGNVIPYEYTIALAENAVDNGVEVRIRREVIDIQNDTSNNNKDDEEEEPKFIIRARHWEPRTYVDAFTKRKALVLFGIFAGFVLATMSMTCAGLYIMLHTDMDATTKQRIWYGTLTLILAGLSALYVYVASGHHVSRKTPLKDIVDKANLPKGKGGKKVSVQDMLTGGSGSYHVVEGVTVEEETIKARYIVNCAGGAADKIANMIGDYSFKIKPRLGDYLLLNRNQGHLTRHTLFPCPDPVLGKGVLVQTTLWGNLILGPTARDTYKPEAANMSDASVQEYILSKCKKLVPYFDPKETFHAFCGARAKSDVGDWIVGPSEKDARFVNVAGIDSPGLAGSPAIAPEVVTMLRDAGLRTPANPNFNPNRAPIITPKVGMKGLKMGPVGKFDSDGVDEKQMASNVICKCEKVTELEVVRACRRSLPIDSTQAIRKRTRAGMGHCQGDPDNYDCERRVKAIIARENGVPVELVGGRPWPATSSLSQRWIDEEEKKELEERMMK